jgi:hypothetical protein
VPSRAIAASRRAQGEPAHKGAGDRYHARQQGALPDNGHWPAAWAASVIIAAAIANGTIPKRRRDALNQRFARQR